MFKYGKFSIAWCFYCPMTLMITFPNYYILKFSMSANCK